MDFHDLLHGHIEFRASDPLTALLRDLINSPEINRLRNMRQMNFDVPLIQELGRARRLPHSIGVTYIAAKLAERSGLGSRETKVLVAAAMLHDAAIPPYGHLVESEFKNAGIDFKHERRVEELIQGTINSKNKYLSIVPGKSLQVSEILDRHDVDASEVIRVICPNSGSSPISSDIDIDNLDNVHRMAAMLGWPGASENVRSIVQGAALRGLGQMAFSGASRPYLERWLDYRQRIYTMIIGHPECIPYNALQVDMVRIAVAKEIISPRDWFLSEPLFEEALRANEHTRALAIQLISGCDYQMIDYVWIKSFRTSVKMNNAQISDGLDSVDRPADHGYFVWNERGLVCRQIHVLDEHSHVRELGEDSTSCMIALVKKTPGKPRWSKPASRQWRTDVIAKFSKMFAVNDFEVDFPETYTGEFLGNRNSELRFGYY